MTTRTLASPLALLLGGIKFLMFTSLMFMFLIHQSLAVLIIPFEKWRMKYTLFNVKVHSWLALKILNVRVKTEGQRGEVRGRSIMANHLSYVDVLILAVHYPSVFVTSVEMGDVPVLGSIAKRAGCLFVERRREFRDEMTKARELKRMKDKLTSGLNVLIFPEGTSSDGMRLLPFKATFFQLSLDTGLPIVPLCLKYSGESKKMVPWYGDMTFPDHLLKLCFLMEIEASVVELGELPAFGDKFALAEKTRGMINEVYWT